MAIRRTPEEEDAAAAEMERRWREHPEDWQDVTPQTYGIRLDGAAVARVVTPIKQRIVTR